MSTLPHSVDAIRIFSDQCAEQFKNKFLAHSLVFLADKFNLKIEWNYTASQHGKSICDGIGATAKSIAFRKVMTGVTVQNAEDFAKTCDGSKIIVEVLSEENMNDCNKMCDTKSIFSKSKPLHGISTKHQIKIENKKIIMSESSV